MGIKSKIIKKCCFSCFFLISFVCKSQVKNANDFITVNTTIAGRGDYDFGDGYKSTDNSSYFIVTTIKNKKDTAISFYIMENSWRVDNIKLSNDSIYVLYFGSDVNFTTKITLQPCKSISLNFIVRPKHKTVSDISFKVGFRFTDPKEFYVNSIRLENEANKQLWCWGNLLKLEPKGYTYIVEE